MARNGGAAKASPLLIFPTILTFWFLWFIFLQKIKAMLAAAAGASTALSSLAATAGGGEAALLPRFGAEVAGGFGTSGGDRWAVVGRGEPRHRCTSHICSSFASTRSMPAASRIQRTTSKSTRTLNIIWLWGCSIIMVGRDWRWVTLTQVTRRSWIPHCFVSNKMKESIYFGTAWSITERGEVRLQYSNIIVATSVPYHDLQCR